MMSYRLSIEAVRCPENAMTVWGGTPARIRWRTPLRPEVVHDAIGESDRSAHALPHLAEVG
jgi:hypothetical protein